MKIVYGQELSLEQEQTIMNIANECGILFDTARLLYYRNQNTVEKVKRFLSPGEHGLHNAYLLTDMQNAVDRITLAKNANENVLIFGDYDADGVCASSLLHFALKEFGIKNLDVFVPEREMGYGLNLEYLTNLNLQQKIDLIITVDCGISDCEKIEELKKLGIDVIVTDHHEPPSKLPECIKINPKIEGQQYPFNGLCGAGVAYKLASALIGKNADKYLDLVAVATVADSMDLVDENRDIVAIGLKLINNERTQRIAFKYLINESTKQITAQSIAYLIAPRINAGGRMGDAKSALDLFVETDPNKIFDLSVKLNSYNVERQAECDGIYNQSKEIIKKHSLHKRNVIMIKNKEWSAGFVGIVAAKLVEEFARPVIVFGGQGDNLKGSARSVDGINIYDAIANAKDLLVGYGGHAQAAGIAVSESNFLAVERLINNYVDETYGKIKHEQISYAEWNINQTISLRFAREIELLEPFGVGNKRPIFTTEINSVNSSPLRVGSPHYSFNTEAIEMLDFNGENHVLSLHLPTDKKILFEINLSTFKGRQSIKGYVKGISTDYSNLSTIKTHVFVNELRRLLEEGGCARTQTDFEFEKNGVGTIYVLSDPDNASEFAQIKDLPLNLFKLDSKNFNNCVIVSPMSIPQGYDRVVYLDRPMQFIKSDACSICLTNISASKFIDELSTDREDFIRIYSKLLTLKNNSFISTASFSEKHAKNENVLQFAFVVEVFMELGIFEVKNGIFCFNEKIKNTLTNSLLYSKINLLKAQYV